VLEAFESVGDKTPDEIIEHIVSVGEEWAKGVRMTMMYPLCVWNSSSQQRSGDHQAYPIVLL
jgi:hypothetical protein